MKIKVNTGIGDTIAAALGLKQGRAQFDGALNLDSGIVPVVVLAGSLTGSPSTSSASANADVDAGNCYVGFWFLGPGGAGNITWGQLKNPSGSGKVVYLDSVVVKCPTAASVFSLRTFDTDGANLVMNGVNKKLGAVGSAAQIRSNNNAVMPGGAVEIATALTPPDPAAAGTGANFEDVLRQPIRLDAGKGIIVTVNAANNTGFGHFCFREYNA